MSPRSPSARFRVGVGVVLIAVAVGRPVRLTTVQWWFSPEIAASIALTRPQRDAIEELYRASLGRRRQCVEQLVEANQRVDELFRDGAEDHAFLEHTEAAAIAAAEERASIRELGDEIAALLSPHQREQLLVWTSGRILD